ncbi:unnamed protein product [Blepharisma stoltei]|uniref:Uncharacterized protein n=1 Tax=Blepharisma stoltei TaxID=1481888 RepID=A0AAU9JF87_9CILI|nr:unnamed protein product [Blepharisma stoltei]
MGCITGKSMIRPQAPGQRLLNTGIPEFDKLFHKCEVPIKLITDCRADLDLYTTDFVKSLGAQRQWELNPSIQELTLMMLVILSTMGKGNMDSIGVSYSSESPYISVDPKTLKRGAKKMMNFYYQLVNFMAELPTKLEKLVGELNGLVIKAQDFPKVVSEKCEELNFSMKDKLLAIKNTNSNYKEISSAPVQLTEILRITEEARSRILETCEQAQIAPQSDRIISRGVQAAAEGLSMPSEIVNKFWAVC